MGFVLLIAVIVGGALATATVILVAVVAVSRRVVERAATDLRADLGDVRLHRLTPANWLGDSSRRTRVRGTGALALTDRGLHFRLAVPERRLDIPLERLVDASLTRQFGRPGYYQAALRPILQVRYRVDSGESVTGWRVRDPAAWKADLDRARGGR